MSLNDSGPLPGTKIGSVTPVRRDAVGAEIPVTVHASRTTQSLGNNLPPVHEDTKTVIVLPEGAVVRMTASLVRGETVVLTNRMTGADVLCRVGNVKAQPGIRQYVDLEFTQRAPGFWGEAIATPSAPATVQPPAPSARPAVSAPIPAPVSIVEPPAAPKPAPPPSPVTLAPQIPAAVAPAAPPVAAPTAAPNFFAATPAVPVHQDLETGPLVEPAGAAWKDSEAGSSSPAFSEVTDRSGLSTLGTLSTGGGSPSTHTNLLGAAAAIVLLLVGAGGGYWFYSQKASAPGSPIAQQAPSVPAPLPVAPQPNPSATAPAAEPMPEPTASSSPAPQTEIVLESRPEPIRETPPPRVQKPVPVEEPPATVVRRSAVPIEPMKSPQARPTPVRVDSGAAPPSIAGSLNFGDGDAANPLLAAENLGPGLPPAPARPAAGGQLQPPQILSSTPPVYPLTARSLKLQGDVQLDALVDETGKVAETNVISGPPALVAAARDAVQKWKYKPAQLNGKPIAVHTRVSVHFNLAQ